ncbi:hypothetical protein Acr_03g0001580 [Actinidia rufa]|uniref:Uncharacterized protein n=1 Tax=Actinidia rufa TaxID=165716 RepID=A0A7J0EA64_9ERIC|nr:hypothetical protein Acr_03g0001580 [Actinidia rufa]
MINVGMMVELLEEYRAAMSRVRDQLLRPTTPLHFLSSLRSASTSSISAQDSSSFLVYF